MSPPLAPYILYHIYINMSTPTIFLLFVLICQSRHYTKLYKRTFLRTKLIPRLVCLPKTGRGTALRFSIWLFYRSHLTFFLLDTVFLKREGETVANSFPFSIKVWTAFPPLAVHCCPCAHHTVTSGTCLLGRTAVAFEVFTPTQPCLLFQALFPLQ